jgi:hypothetical protein
VAPGAWEVWADFGGGHVRAGEVVVAEGEVIQLRCSRIKQQCSGVKP